MEAATRSPRRARAGATLAWRLIWAALLCVLGLSHPAPSAAQDASAAEIARNRERLDLIRSEREKLRGEMSTLRNRAHGLTSELRNLERQLSTSASLVQEIDVQMAATSQTVQQTIRDLLGARDRLAESKAVLHRRLRDIYKRGPLFTAEVLLRAETFGDLLNRYKYLYLITQRDRRLVQDIGDLEQRLALREREMRRNLGYLRELHNDRTRELQELERLERQRKSALSSTQARERSASQQLEQLAADERRISSLIAALERRRKSEERAAAARPGGRSATDSRAPAAGAITTADLGSLGWPVEGRIAYRFGRTTQPGGGTIRYNGLGIAAPVGTVVRAVAAGTVELARPFEGYGPTVVVSHGGGYYSLYLYLQNISTREGERVDRNQNIGTVGGADTPEGAHLEFQIRAPGGQAVDPLDWLRNRER